MRAFRFIKPVCVSALLLLIGATGHATTLKVSCGQKSGLSTIGAALQILQNPGAEGPKILNVAGAALISGGSLTVYSSSFEDNAGVFRRIRRAPQCHGQ